MSDFFNFDTDFSIKKYTFEEVRRDYPNAYAKWTEEDDELLKDEFLEGKSTEELARIFERKPNAIRYRLKKLGLVTYKPHN